MPDPIGGLTWKAIEHMENDGFAYPLSLCIPKAALVIESDAALQSSFHSDWASEHLDSLGLGE